MKIKFTSKTDSLLTNLSFLLLALSACAVVALTFNAGTGFLTAPRRTAAVQLEKTVPLAAATPGNAHKKATL